MALQRDGNSRSCVSRKPYDANNSFVKKMARKVTGLIGWPSESQAAVSQNRDSIFSSGDEDIAPNAKRLRLDIADTLCIPSTSRDINNVYSPIQPVNELNAYSKNYRNKYLMSSTPAIQSSSDKIPLSDCKSDAGIPSASTSTQPTEYQSYGSSITGAFDINESVNSSLTVPQLRIDQKHNVTVPALSNDVLSQMYQDKSKLSGSFSYTNSRAPSFNVGVFSNSSRRLSASVCENRNSSSLSPFYSARTMYGGASALLPYGKQNVGRMRSPYTSKLNLFSPRSSQITIQPVRSAKISDQETMSAAARRILDTLEKYCSPVMDAKKIPINKSTKSMDSDTSLQSLSKGVKRKLQSLSQITPNTTDLLRIKRKEQMQDSVSNARQIVFNVPESSIVAGDSDSFDSVDLDYSILDESSKVANSQKYISQIRQKKDNKIEDSPVSGMKLPNAVLKMTNLPKFDITDMFTFSKPVLVENLEQSVTEIIGAVEDSSKNSELKFQVIPQPAISMFKPPNTDKPILKDPSKTVPSLLAKSPVTSENNNNYKLVSPPKPAPTFLSSSLTFTKHSTKVKTASWTCKVCLLESTEESCSSCSSTREQNTTPVQPPNPTEKTNALSPTIQTLPICNWENKFKPPSNTWECKECFVRNSNNLTKCASCDSPNAKANDLACKESPKTNTNNQKADGKPNAVVLPPSGTNDLWKNLQKYVAGSWTCDSCWVQNKPSVAKCGTCGDTKEPTKSCSVDKVVEAPKSEFLFGMDKVDGPSPSAALNIDKTLCRGVGTATTSVTSKPTSTFDVSSTPSTPTMSAVSSSNDTTSSTSTSITTFSFGANNAATAASPIQFSFGATKVTSPVNTPSNNPLVDGFQGEKHVENKKDAPIFNDVSSSTNNTKNPLLQKKPDTSSSNNTNILKTPKLSVTKNVFANKENGENGNAGNTYNNISSSTSDSSLSTKKNSFPAFGSAAAAAPTPSNIFGSNGFAKPDNATATGSNMTVVSSSVSNVFNSTFSPTATPATITSKVNDSQTSIFTTETDTEEVKMNNKDPKMFSSPINRSVVSSSQQPNTNSVFGALTNDTFGFGSKKSNTQGGATFNAASTFSFGLMSGTSSTQASQQTIGFSFNGPKAAEHSTSKFMFGGSTNTFGNSAAVGATVTPTQFAFSTLPATDGEQSRVNSLFSANPLKTLPEQQVNINCVPTFGNSVFGADAQQLQPIAKKSGGFNFAPSSQSTLEPVNSFNSFTNSTNENQDQNRLIANAAPAFTPFVFGRPDSQNAQAHNFNLTVPPTFNFSSGNPLTSFTAQPLTNSNQTPAVATRKIRKAVRRTAK